MSEAKWLDDYAGQTTGELIAMESEYRADSLVLAAEKALSDKALLVGLVGLTDPERVVLAVEALEREVNNGGYYQFFECAKQLVPFVVDSLTAIGCEAVASITADAIDVLAIDGALTPEAIDAAIADDDDDRDEALGECDDRYYDDAGDLAGPLLAFIKANRAGISLT